MSSKFFPSTGEKPKFNPDAAYEVVQDTPAPKGAKPAFNPNKKFEVVVDAKPEQPKAESVQFKPMTDWLSIPQAAQPIVKENVVNDHNTKTAESVSRVKAHIGDIDHSIRNLLYNHKKELQGRVKSQQLAINPTEAAPINFQAQQLEQKERKDVHVSPYEVEGFKIGMNENPVLLRRGLEQKVKDLSKSKPAEANALKADIYRLDRQNNPDKEPKISKNIDKINSGEYDYDVLNGRLVKREGFFPSLVTGWKQKSNAFNDYDVYRGGDEKEILKLINKRLKDDPDEAVSVPDGMSGEAGVILGGQPLKPIVAGGIAGYFSGGLAGGAAAAAVSAPEMYRLTFGSSLPHNYDALKKQNPNASDSEILQKAIDLTNDQANADALSGAAMGALGARAVLKPATSVLLQKSVKSALKQIGETVAVEGLGGGAIGAAGQLVKNLMAQKAGINLDESEGMAQQLVGGAMMTLGMSLAAKAGNILRPSTYNKLLHGLSKAPDDIISAELNKAQELGVITPEDAQRVQRDISQQREIDGSIRGDVPESERLKVQEKIKQRDAKEKELETAHKAYHPEIKEEIKKLDEDILSLSKGADRGELQQLIDKEHKEGNIEGFVTEPLRDASESDLKKYFKEISEQAHDPNSEAITIETFGENIVNKAKELYPKSEDARISVTYPKRTGTETTVDGVTVIKPEIEDAKGVSVIRPGEIKQPETITIKPQEDAIPEQITNEMDVRQQAGNVEAMGEGNVQPEIPAGEESGGPTEAQSTPAGQEGIGEPPLPPTEGKGVFVERPDTQLSFRGLQDTANEFGFEDVRSRDQKSDLQTRVNAERTANEWARRGEYQHNIDDMLDKIERKVMLPTDEQRLILEQYLANEKQKTRDIPKSSPEYDAQLQKLQRIKDVGQIARSGHGAALRLPDEGSRVHPINDEADAMVAKMEANSVDKLTDQQKAEVEAQVEKYRQRDEEAKSKIAELEAQVAKLDAQKAFNKAKSTTKRTKKTTEERVAYRRSELDAAREALRKLRTGESGLSAVPLPGVRELMAIAPHVKNIMVDLVAQGVDNLQDVVSHLHTEFKEVLDGITEKNIHDIIAGVYNEKAQPLSELRRQVMDIQDEAKYINQLEALLNGKAPKGERAKIVRNQKIKELKDKIKDFRKEEAEANKFYGESDAGERRLDKLRDELDRIQDRRQKEKPAKGSQADKEISSREQELRDQIMGAQAEWDIEKEAGRQAQRDYVRLEAERNRQLQRVLDLKEKLDNLQKGIKSKGKPASKKVDTPEIESLKKQVSDAEKQLNKTIATEKRIKALEEELDRLQQRKEKEPKEESKSEVTDREIELKKQIDEERKAFRDEVSEANKFYKEELDEDAKKLIAIKKRNQKREQEIKAKIAAGQFEQETKTSIFDREDIKKNYPRLRKDALDAIAKKEEAQHEFDLALYKDEMEQRSKVRKFFGGLGKVIHTSKAVMSGIDDSATFVQNGLAMMANPKIGAKVWLEHWKDAFNEPRFRRELAALHADPDFELMQKSGLDIVEPHNAASKKVEEAFEQNLLAGKIKIDGKEFQPWKYTGGIFERAFTSMGNNMRVALFKKQIAALKEAKKTFESHPEDYKAAARAINELTGRGHLPSGLAQASPYITPFIWAPRMLTSTINVLGLSDLALGVAGKGYYQNLTPSQRKFALGQLGRGVAMGVGVMVAAALGGATVDYDPRSVTFGDVIMGDHHYNVFGRYTPVIKALVQFTMGERIKKGGAQDLDSGKRGAKTRMGVVGGFFRGKMTPFAGSMYDLAEGKNYFTNEPFGVKDLPAALTTPMSVKELVEGWKNDGTWTILNRFLPAFEGLKVSDERDFKKKVTSASGGGGATGSYRSGRAKRSNPHKSN